MAKVIADQCRFQQTTDQILYNHASDNYYSTSLMSEAFILPYVTSSGRFKH